MFVDDMVLFCEESQDQRKVVLTILDMFCRVSSQKVNVLKSCVYVSSNVDGEGTTSLANQSGMRLVTDLSRHLRVPSIHAIINQSTYGYLLHNMKQRLEGWKAKTLSIMESITLVQSVLSTIPIYSMQTSVSLVFLCQVMERICRNFIWHGALD